MPTWPACRLRWPALIGRLLVGVCGSFAEPGVAFLPARRYASAGLCDSDVSVRPDIRHAGIVPSRAKAGS